MSLRRQLYSSSPECPYGCKYCFASREDYNRQDTLDKNNIDDSIDIIYPSCDSELFFSSRSMSWLESIIDERNKKTIISISTKSRINENASRRISLLDEHIENSVGGFIKVSISISNYSMIDDIEPKTSSFDERIKSLEYLKEEEINRSINIRPILPFLKFKEYKYIISKCLKYTDNFLLGGLYVEEGSGFFKRYVSEAEANITLEDRDVEWLDGNPTWKYATNKELNRQIKKFISSSGGSFFNNDVSLIDKLSQ